MKKTRLDVVFNYDFELLGISSTARGHKLAWEINRVLKVDLVKKDDLKITGKDGDYFFAHYAHQSSVNSLQLFRNKANETDSKTAFLVPEHPKFDFILYSMGDDEVSGKRLQEVLRNIPSIELVAFIPLAALKSKDNFIF